MTDCTTCTERQGYYMDAETIKGQQEHIRQLEAQVSALARENAELKQVPRHVDDAPRCPLRDGMTGEMGACDKRCAWLVDVAYWNDYTGEEMYFGRTCSEAAKTLDADNYVMRPVNYWNEVD